MYFNIDAKKQHTYDAIVIGSGISGGWVAKELCDKGLKTLVLERGRQVEHIKDYPTATMETWQMPYRGGLPPTFKEENPVASKCYALNDFTEHFFVKDQEHPYVQEKPFDWIRGYQVGGKSLLWARQTQRWSPYDFEGPARDGYAVDWPIRYDDLADWYTHVEHFAGISGNKDGLDTLPDGDFLPPMELNCVEKHFQQSIRKHYDDRHMIAGRCAHLTEVRDIHRQQGRGNCQYRHYCYRGCPYGAYFSSNSSTIPWAAKTGNLTMRPDSVVHSIIYDEDRGRASGVKVIDANTKEEVEYFARVIFVNASTINTNLLLLNSTSTRFPEGLGNDSGTLGKYVAFHNYRARVTAKMDQYMDQYYVGRRPNGGYIPRFRNVKKQDADFLRGYAVYISASREDWGRDGDTPDFGADFKRQMMTPGEWSIFVMAMGETLPKESNQVSLHPELKDAWGMPQLVTSIDYDDNDEKMILDFHLQASEMLDKAGFKDIATVDTGQAPGLDIHEMGGCRMGRDPKTSMLNEWNQMHAVNNVYVTDGACMTSTSTQNPSLTYMALSARAAHHAAEEMKRRNV
jgi:choline dehydrogenase-like flavoprotein